MKQDRVVVITGAAGGMGSVLVGRFLANGDTVVATDIREAEDCAKLAAACDHAGLVDVLINCAGYYPIVAFEKMMARQWREIIDLNLTGNFLMTPALLPLMKGRALGRIINFGSASVFEGVPGAQEG
jgi:NAD(P)-dependent dehydrogenase (short-subunit alcohol dehydrogenase family)